MTRSHITATRRAEAPRFNLYETPARCREGPLSSFSDGPLSTLPSTAHLGSPHLKDTG